LVILLGGCLSQNSEQAFRDDLSARVILMEPIFDGKLSETLSDVQGRWNAAYPQEKPITLRLDGKEINMVGNSGPRQTNVCYMGSSVCDPINYAKLLARIAGKSVKLDPANRAIILEDPVQGDADPETTRIEKGQPPAGGD